MSVSTSSSRSVSSARRSWRAASAWRAGGGRANRSRSRRVTDGARSASPAATRRIAATKSAGGTSLSRNPLAPARSASTTYSSASKVVRIRTRDRVVRARPRQPAGRLDAVHDRHPDVHHDDVRTQPAGRLDAPRDRRAASPTTSMSGSSARIIRKPVRTSCWSSTRSTRMGGSGDGTRRPGRRAAGRSSGSRAGHPEPAAGAGPPRGCRRTARRARLMPISPRPGSPSCASPPAAAPPHPPSSTTSTSSVAGRSGSSPDVPAVGACLSVLVRASWTIR